jgi:hypothetical protein
MNCNRRGSLWLALLLPALLLTVTGCSGITTVQNVQAHPHRNWFTSTVYLQGTVGKQAPLLKGQLYELKDATGKIWVLSSTQPLRVDSLIRIKGKVRYQKIEIAGQNLGEAYIEEQQRLAPEPDRESKK